MQILNAAFDRILKSKGVLESSKKSNILPDGCYNRFTTEGTKCFMTTLRIVLNGGGSVGVQAEKVRECKEWWNQSLG